MASPTGGSLGSICRSRSRTMSSTRTHLSSETLFVSPHAEQRNLFYGINFDSRARRRPLRKKTTRWKCARSSVSAIPSMGSSLIPSSMSASEKSASSISLRRPGAKIRPGSLCRLRILHGPRPDRTLADISKSGAYAICGHRFLAWHDRREFRCRLRADASLRTLDRQDHPGLRVSGAGFWRKRQRSRPDRTCQPDVACDPVDLVGMASRSSVATATKRQLAASR